MPKILIAVSDTDKKVRRAATSIPNVKKICKARSAKFDDHSFTIYTFEDKMTLSHVCLLINSTTKKLHKNAEIVQDLEINPDTGRCKLTDS